MELLLVVYILFWKIKHRLVHQSNTQITKRKGKDGKKSRDREGEGEKKTIQAIFIKTIEDKQ